MKVIIAGGGTGGHLFPAVAVGEELVRQRPATDVLYVGTSAGFEAKWLPRSGYDFELFDVHGIRGHGPLARIRATLEFLRALTLARALLKKFQPDLVVAVGGYASAPTAVAGILARVPIVMLEQNTGPGLSNRLLWRFAKKICVAFPESANHFGPAKVEVTGNPVRYRPRPERQPLDGRPLQILVLGGSTGAHRLNIGVLRAFKIWENSVIKLTIVHQTGEGDEAAVRDAYREFSFDAHAQAFIDDIPDALSRADLVIARAGSGTVTDIALAARAAIFVPYPFHRDMQQLHNARVIERLGGATIVTDDDHLAENLAREMKRLLDDPKLLVKMGEKASAAGFPDAATRVARVCFQVAKTQKAA